MFIDIISMVEAGLTGGGKNREPYKNAWMMIVERINPRK